MMYQSFKVKNEVTRSGNDDQACRESGRHYEHTEKFIPTFNSPEGQQQDVPRIGEKDAGQETEYRKLRNILPLFAASKDSKKTVNKIPFIKDLPTQANAVVAAFAESYSKVKQ